MKHLGIMNVLLMVVQVAGHVFMMLLIRHICCWYHLTDDHTVVISSNNASDPNNCLCHTWVTLQHLVALG